VRALVAAREDLVLDSRQHDAGAVRLDQRGLAGGEIVETTDAAATHISSFVTKAR
jgi:hypothetical protein